MSKYWKFIRIISSFLFSARQGRLVNHVWGFGVDPQWWKGSSDEDKTLRRNWSPWSVWASMSKLSADQWSFKEWKGSTSSLLTLSFWRDDTINVDAMLLEESSHKEKRKEPGTQACGLSFLAFPPILELQRWRCLRKRPRVSYPSSPCYLSHIIPNHWKP